MSILANKYNIPEETVKQMIKDGVVSCSWPTYDEIMKLRSMGKSAMDIAAILNITERQVYKVIKKVN